MMNPYYHQRIRELLESEIVRVTADIKQLAPHCEPVPPDKGLGRITRMEVLSDRARNEAVLENLQSLLVELEEAFERIDAEDFGLCKRCKKEIQYERLKIVPGARYCIGCA